MWMANARRFCRSAAGRAHDACGRLHGMHPPYPLAASVRRGLRGAIVAMHAGARCSGSASMVSLPRMSEAADPPCVSPQHVQKRKRRRRCRQRRRFRIARRVNPCYIMYTSMLPAGRSSAAWQHNGDVAVRERCARRLSLELSSRVYPYLKDTRSRGCETPG